MDVECLLPQKFGTFHLSDFLDPIPSLHPSLRRLPVPGDALGSFPCDGQVHLAAHQPTERALFASQADLQCATRAAVNGEELGDRQDVFCFNNWDATVTWVCLKIVYP